MQIQIIQTVLPIHQRMAELYTVNQMRELNLEEIDEMVQCLQVNAKICWEYAYIENIKFMESMISNVDWVDEISLDEQR